MKIIFWGTPQFAVPVLEALVNESGFDVVGVVTNPDEPTGRKKELTPPSVKVSAQKYNIPVLQPAKLKNNQEFFGKFKKLNPDICIIRAYGKIIPTEYLDIPKYGFINIHPSLLPKYRGPTPVQTALLNGEEETGATIALVDKEVDHGNILAVQKYKIKNEYYKELENKLSEIGGKLLIKTLRSYVTGEIKSKSQDHSQATFTKKFIQEDGKINWNEPAKKIHNQTRALSHEPGTYTFWNGRRIKIFDTEMEECSPKTEPGKVIVEKNKILVKTETLCLNIKKMQIEGKKIMSAEEFIKGYPKIAESTLK